MEKLKPTLNTLKTGVHFNVDDMFDMAGYQKDYYLENVDKIKKRHANYRLDNVNEIKEQGAVYRLKNAHKIKEQGAKYYLKNAQKIGEKVVCDGCDRVGRRGDITRHKRSDIHKKIMLEKSSNDDSKHD